MFVMCAEKNKLRVLEREPVTSGSVNAYEILFEFSEDWDGMERVAVFKTGKGSRSVLLDGTGRCGIPWEVMEAPGVFLMAGVYGTRGGAVVLPTVWASLGMILEGVTTGEDTQPPTPDLWQQELAGKGDALNYDGLNLSLMSGDKPLSTVKIAGGSGPPWGVGHGLKVVDGELTVNTVDNFAGDNTLPMTAAGVQSTVGNIEALLGTI